MWQILNEKKRIGNHWTGFYVNGDNVTNFDTFGFEFKRN